MRGCAFVLQHALRSVPRCRGPGGIECARGRERVGRPARQAACAPGVPTGTRGTERAVVRRFDVFQSEALEETTPAARELGPGGTGSECIGRHSGCAAETGAGEGARRAGLQGGTWGLTACAVGTRGVSWVRPGRVPRKEEQEVRAAGSSVRGGDTGTPAAGCQQTGKRGSGHPVGQCQGGLAWAAATARPLSDAPSRRGREREGGFG